MAEQIEESEEKKGESPERSKEIVCRTVHKEVPPPKRSKQRVSRNNSRKEIEDEREAIFFGMGADRKDDSKIYIGIDLETSARNTRKDIPTVAL